MRFLLFPASDLFLRHFPLLVLSLSLDHFPFLTLGAGIPINSWLLNNLYVPHIHLFEIGLEFSNVSRFNGSLAVIYYQEDLFDRSIPWSTRKLAL